MNTVYVITRGWKALDKMADFLIVDGNFRDAGKVFPGVEGLPLLSGKEAFGYDLALGFSGGFIGDANPADHYHLSVLYWVALRVGRRNQMKMPYIRRDDQGIWPLYPGVVDDLGFCPLLRPWDSWSRVAREHNQKYIEQHDPPYAAVDAKIRQELSRLDDLWKAL